MRLPCESSDHLILAGKVCAGITHEALFLGKDLDDPTEWRNPFCWTSSPYEKNQISRTMLQSIKGNVCKLVAGEGCRYHIHSVACSRVFVRDLRCHVSFNVTFRNPHAFSISSSCSCSYRWFCGYIRITIVPLKIDDSRS